jgi:hypothetical protein
MKNSSGHTFYHFLANNLNSRKILIDKNFGEVKAKLFGESLKVLGD